MDLTYFYIAFATCFVALMIVIGYAMFLRIKIASFNHKASVPKGDPVVQRNLINSFQTGSIMPVIYDITSKSLRLLLPNQDGKIAELEGLFESPLPIGDLSRFTIGEDCDALISFFENLQAPNASRAFSVVARIDKNRNFHQYFEIVIAPKVMSPDSSPCLTGYIKPASCKNNTATKYEFNLSVLAMLFDKANFQIEVFNPNNDYHIIYANEAAKTDYYVNIGDTVEQLAKSSSIKHLRSDLEDTILKRKVIQREFTVIKNGVEEKWTSFCSPLVVGDKIFAVSRQWNQKSVVCIANEPQPQDEPKDDIPPHAPAPEVPEKRKISSKFKILVAEDNIANFKLTDVLLKDIAHCQNATSGQAAIEMLQSSDFDLVIMDIKMPSMDGLAATREIRKFNKIIPIIAVTANVFDYDRNLCIKAGCNEFMSKPLKRFELNALVKKLLS